VPEYVTDAELVALMGPSSDPARVTLATGAANLLIPGWCEQHADADGLEVVAPVTPVTRQAALELAHELYRAHSAVGGVFQIEELLARLPADRARPIRDLLDSAAQVWGLS